jgi:non-specific serine/threonine protein kinase/serine/threonine-protein kinase
MRPESRFQRLEALFHELEQLTPGARQMRLDGLRSDEPELHDELRSMFDAGLTRLEAVEALSSGSDDWLSASAQVPDRIGPYRIIAPLGQGGMGRVYEAEQLEPVQRRVALKVARDLILSDSARDRFLAERQALAVLDHPNIAKVFDAGSTESGQLWFAMELVPGVTITQWADRQHLNLRERIELFLPVCEAVQHAHQKGLIHRDLKPSNLLVVDQDGRAQVRVIDFGIAKALEVEGSGTAGATRMGEALGTPEYMSPEQATLGEVDIDTRSDVYSLGLVLHALLTGRLPIEAETLKGASFGELCRRVRDDPIIAPSRLEAEEAAPVARRELRGDLDLVLLKALAKDREQRYSSASALAEDLRRVLDFQPVSAAQPSVRYRMSKFIRRHRLPVTLAAAASLGLMVLTAVAWRQADIAAVERDRARVEAERSSAVVAFLQDMLASADPARAQGRELTVNELLDQARDALSSSELDIQARAAVEETLATTYNSLGRPEDGLPLAREASRRLREALGEDDPLTLAAQHAEARFYVYLGRYEEAIELLEQTLAGRERVLGAHMDTASTMHNLAYAWAELGEIERALEMDRRQLMIVEQLAGQGSLDALVTSSSIAHGLTVLERYPEATELFEHILAGYRRQLGERHPNTLSVMHNLAYLARAQGDLERAEVLYRDVLVARRSVLGSSHLKTLNSVANLGLLYLDQGRLVLAEPLIQEALEGRQAALGPTHADTLASRIDRLRLRAYNTEGEGWLAEADELLETTRTHFGSEDQLVMQVKKLRDEFLEQRHE